MDHLKIAKALNTQDLDDITARISTHSNRFNIVAKEFIDFRNKAADAFNIYCKYIPLEHRQPIIDDLQAMLYLYDDLAECLIMFGEDMATLSQHNVDCVVQLREAIYGE